jgi:glutaminase
MTARKPDLDALRRIAERFAELLGRDVTIHQNLDRYMFEHYSRDGARARLMRETVLVHAEENKLLDQLATELQEDSP